MSTGRLGVVPLLLPPRRVERLLREVAGMPVVDRAVRALAVPGVVDRVLVLVGEDAAPRAKAVCRSGPGVSVDLLVADRFDDAVVRLPECLGAPAPGSGPERRAAGQAADPIMLLLDPAQLVTPVALLTAVAAVASAPGGGVVLPVRPVTDTLKQVDAEGIVLSTVPREAHLEVLTPLALPLRLLRAAAPGLVAWDLPELLRRLLTAGTPVRTVPAGADVLLAEGEDGLDVTLAALGAEAADLG